MAAHGIDVMLIPFACHPERSEGSPQFAQAKLREASQYLLE
jgi:hypothetical protein